MIGSAARRVNRTGGAAGARSGSGLGGDPWCRAAERLRARDRHLDEGAEPLHRLDVTAPDLGDLGQNLVALPWVGDLACRRRQISLDELLQVEDELRIRSEVVQPGAGTRTRHPRDVDPALEVVEDDLDPARYATPPADGGDVDRVAVAQDAPYGAGQGRIRVGRGQVGEPGVGRVRGGHALGGAPST